MPDDDIYFTINEKYEGLFKDKGSKFMACVFPFEDETKLKDLIEETKSLYPRARHYCYAYQIGVSGDHYRANDDGEPSGSAGKPILNVILSKKLTNVLIVVARYFGGTLLGVPGLINAYKSASLTALEEADIITRYVREVYLFRFTFEKMNEIMRVVKENELKVLSQTYDDLCGLEVEIRQSLVSKVLAKVEDIREIEAGYLRTI
jgi:uncharacterized YigZ family protein